MKRKFVRTSALRASLIKDPDTLREGRARLLEVALGLFQELGYHRTSVRAIAERAEISVGTLFNYFSGKEDLLFHLLSSGQEVWERPMEPLRSELDRSIEKRIDPERLLTSLFARYVRNVDETRRYVLLAYQETKSLVPEARHDLFDRELRLMEIFEQALRYGVVEGKWPDGSLRVKSHSIVMLAQVWALRRWVLRDEVTSFEEYVRRLQPVVLAIAKAEDDDTSLPAAVADAQ